MDLILFLIFAGVIFYFSQIKPRLEQQQAAAPDTAEAAKIHRHKPAPANTHQPMQQRTKHADRPSGPVLLGIEITAAQQRRLGKNDPSVLAAQRAKQLHLAQHTGSTWFEQLTSQAEHVLQQPNETSKHRSTASRPQQKSTFNKMFEDLFSK